jgi:hypothetical protein
MVTETEPQTCELTQKSCREAGGSLKTKIVEGFTTPRSNVRTAKSPPCRSTKALLHSAGLSAPWAVPGHSSVPDPHMAGYPSLSRAGHTTPEYPLLGHATQTHNHRDPSLELLPQLPRIPAPNPFPPHPTQPTALQALLSPSHVWDDQNPPCPSGLAWLQLQWNNWSPTPLGQPHPPACQEPRSLC